MGCDIHLYVEWRVNGVWQSADNWTQNEYYDPSENNGSLPITVEYDNRFYRGRNYNLFAMLADVRNGYGFAGIKTGEGFQPIAMPRGLPDDVCGQVCAESVAWGVDGHSHSWLTVAELDAYDWQQTTQHQGVVDMLNYVIWRNTGKPTAWAGSVEGGSVRNISNAEMDTLVERGRYDDRVYTLVTWHEPYAISAGKFLEETMPRLRALGTPDDVRIVFWFDN